MGAPLVLGQILWGFPSFQSRFWGAGSGWVGAGGPKGPAGMGGGRVPLLSGQILGIPPSFIADFGGSSFF